MKEKQAMSAANRGRRAVVLLVEDDSDHAFLATEALQAAHVLVDLHHVERGDECLAFLRREPPYEAVPRPDLILLDLHLPRVSGYEVMEEIAHDESLRSLCVIVLTSSSDTIDRDRMYALGCNSFLTKPMDFSDFAAAVRKVDNYWFELVVLPRAGGPAEPAP